MIMGFWPIWVRWILECVSIVTYFFYLNGESVGSIRPSREIRQGDLLSCYLFLICAKGLSYLIKKTIENRQIIGVRIGRNFFYYF